MLCLVRAGVEGGVRGCGFEVGGEEGEGFGGGEVVAGVVDGGWEGGGHYYLLIVSADRLCHAGRDDGQDGNKSFFFFAILVRLAESARKGSLSSSIFCV